VSRGDCPFPKDNRYSLDIATLAILPAMSDALERRFRRQTIDRFQTTDLPKVWDALGIGYTVAKMQLEQCDALGGL
jgi:hypothetical protein